MTQKPTQWTIKDFENMSIGAILEVRQENGWVTLVLEHCRIKLKNWK